MKREYGRWPWWLLCAMWLAVIFSQSLMPAALSKAESGGLLARLSALLPFLTERALRKLAHFSEFAVLGALLSFCLPVRISRPLLAGLLCALGDETIQLFVPGRSGQVSDVWIDFAGAAAAIATVFLIRRLWKRSSAAPN